MSIIIRRYTYNDINDIIQLIDNFFNEDRKSNGVINHYKDIDFDKEKLYKVLERYENDITFFCNLIVHNENIVGGLCATVEEQIYSSEKIAYDQIFYISPSFKNLKAIKELIQSYIDWAERRNVRECRLATTTGYRVEAFTKLCNRYGFQLIGNNLAKRF